jgi:hypothetical protein
MPPNTDFSVASSSNTVSRENVMDCIELACLNSQMAGWLNGFGRATFRLTLQKAWPKMSSGGTLNLGPLLDELKKQPSFKVENAVGAFCKLKTWEPWLRWRVVLPGDFVARGILDPTSWANSVKVKDDDLAKALPPYAETLTKQPKRSSSGVDASRPGEEPKGRWVWPVVLVVAAALVLGGGGWFRFRTVEVSPAEVSELIPLSSAKRQWTTVTATLKEPAWLTFSAAERTEHLVASLKRVRVKLAGADTLRLVDGSGELLAEARQSADEVTVDLKR